MERSIYRKTNEDIFSTLLENGVVVIDSYLNKENLSSLHKEFDMFQSATSKQYATPIDYSQGIGCKVHLKKLNCSEYPETCKVFKDGFFSDIAANYLKGEFVLNKEIFVVKDVVGSKHHANDLHYDVAQTLKFFIYLTDTTFENGAFYCVPGSHKWTQKIRKKYSHKISTLNREFTRQLTDEYGDAIPIEGPAGTLIIFDTDVFHKAGTVSKGERRVMRGHTRLTNPPVYKPTLLQRVFNKLGL